MTKKVVISFVLLLLIPVISEAQSNDRLDITVSPISLDLTAKPATTIHNKLRVHNNSKSQVKLAVDIKKITPSNTGIGYQLSEPDTHDEFAKWIHIESAVFTAPALEWVDIPFSIDIPQTAQFGYYPVFVIRADSEKGSPANADITGGVAVITALNVLSPNANVTADLVDFRPLRKWNETFPVPFTVTIKNSGNIHIRPRGNIFISSATNRDIAILEVNPDLSTIIPQSTRQLSAQWINEFISNRVDEQGNKELVIHWDVLPQILFGKYSARLLLVYDAGTHDATLEAVTSVWIFPWKIYLIILVLIICFIAVVYLFIKQRKYVVPYKS